ncbi:MAG TPA: hypothetical protein VKM55_06835 [Candidatus Lokiarchaeia archaeon]|nr:hypothetical protein [Candidatus Lokiarchaeia archaeon]
MTAQENDYCMCNDERYDVLSAMNIIKGQFKTVELFTAKDFGIETHQTSTGNFQGYIMGYAVKNDLLLLDEVEVHGVDLQPPDINGIAPSQDPEARSYYYYHDIGLQVPFTMTFTIGKNFIQTWYIHMGYQPDWAYKTVLELEVDGGAIKNVKDVSDEMAARRKEEGSPKQYKARMSGPPRM